MNREQRIALSDLQNKVSQLEKPTNLGLCDCVPAAYISFYGHDNLPWIEWDRKYLRAKCKKCGREYKIELSTTPIERRVAVRP